MVAVTNNTKKAFFDATCNKVVPSSQTLGYPYCGYSTPPEFTGSYPVHEPTLGGDCKQLLLLDDEWIVFVTNKMQGLIDEIDTLSSNVFQGYIDTWVAGEQAGNPDFTHRANNLWATKHLHIKDARDTVEVPLGVAANFTVTSAGDANYSGGGQNPDQCAKVFVSMGRWRDWAKPVYEGTFNIDYNIYSYLQLPNRMVDGETYTVTHSNGDTVTFTYDLDATVSRAIKVNQVGYLSTAGTKKAYIGAYLYDFGVMDLSHASTYQIINTSDGSVAKSGSISLVEANPQINPQLATGTATATTANKLVDSGATFTSNIKVGDRVYDTSDIAEADVTAVDSDSTLSLSADIFTTGNNYEIRRIDAAVDTGLLYGEDVYEIDFSDMTDTGEFYIKIPGVGRSWPFKHGTDVYNEVFYTATRGFYHQRAGIKLESEYTYWPRKHARLGPKWYASDHVDFPIHTDDQPGGYDEFTVIENTIDTGTSIDAAPGGWHDAADWDLRGFHYGVVFDLLYAYEFNSAKLSDSQLDIPESGDGVPDILSEVRHGLEFWRATQDGVTGGVSGDLETTGIPNVNGTTNDGATIYNYAYSQRTRHNSLIFAAAAAMYARLVQPFDSTDSTLYQTAAENAFTFGANAGNSLGTVTIDTHSWTETADHVNPSLMFAKLQLYLLTGTSTYITDAPSVTTLETSITGSSDGGVEPYNWRFTRYDYSPYIFYSIIQAHNDSAPGLSTLASTWTTWFTNDADTLVDDQLGTHPYENTLLRNMSIGVMRWGNAHPTNYNRALLIAHQLTSTAKYKDAALQNLDFMLGANPMGMCWVTGLGYVYPVDIQSSMGDFDGVDDPPPGITLYGITGDETYSYFNREVWNTTPSTGGEFGAAVTSITQTGGVATVTTTSAHGLTSGDPIEIDFANESEYNVTGDATVTGASTFTYPVDSGATSPATGSIQWRHNEVEATVQRVPPKWRKWWCHPTLNVPQCEYTVDNTMGAMAFSAAYFMASGFTPSASNKRTPREGTKLHGKYYLV